MNIWRKEYIIIRGKGRVKYWNDLYPEWMPKKFRLAF